MSEELTRKYLEAMPLSVQIDKTAKDSPFGASVSRESSFSSVELGASVSRDSSFSSVASSGSGGVFELDSSCPASRSSSWRSNEDGSDIQRILSITDQQYRRLHNARAKFRKGNSKGRNSASSGHESESSSVEMYHTPPESRANVIPKFDKRPEIHGRSSSQPEPLSPIVNHSKLSCPDGLVISTPQVKSFMEYRLRSRSFTGAEQRSDGIQEVQTIKNLYGSRLRVVEDNGREMHCPKSESKENNTENKEDKNLEELREERDSLRRERDRLQCERDAMQVERDALLREKDEMQRELNNRNAVIHHLQDHINLSVKSLAVNDDVKSPPTRLRSKSEVHRPGFFLPDEIAKKNAYTCL